MPPLSRRTVLIASLVTAAVVAAAVIGIVVLRPDDRAGPGRPESASTPRTVVVRTTADPAEADSVAAVTRLVAGLPAQFAAGDPSGLSEGARERFTDLRAALPADTALAVDASSWRRTGAVASVTVTATRPAQPPVQFSLIVIWEAGSWKVSTTVRVGAAS